MKELSYLSRSSKFLVQKPVRLSKWLASFKMEKFQSALIFVNVGGEE